MVGFIYGKSGTGKSEFVFSRIAEASKTGRVYLFVPDREAVAAEGRVADMEGAANIDVVTFRRFCNYVFRRYGGLCEDYIGQGAKKLLMRNVLRTLSPALPEYGRSTGFGTVERLTALRTEFYQNGISPSMLSDASDKMGDTPLKSKSAELSVIFAAYDSEIAARFADPDGILSRGEMLLREHDFFEDATVFIDSFTSFSSQQYALIERMLEGAKDVYITLSYLPEDPDDSAEGLLADTDRRIRRVAERAGISEIQTAFLRGVKRYQNEELAFLGEMLPSSSHVKGIYTEEPKHITVTRAANVFGEAEAAALDICRAVRGGARYRDMVVIVRDTASAEGIVDAVFRKYGIPCFLSDRRDITEMPLVTLIFSALMVIDRGFRGADLISYLKTGLCGVNADEASLFENYIVKWNLRGKAFTGDTPWTMHPRGYKKEFKEQDREILDTLSALRERVIPPLMQFAAALRKEKTVRGRAAVLFDFLTALSVPTALSARAENYKARGELSAAAETVGLWNVFCEALDQLVVCSGGFEVSIAEFSQMLHMILIDTDIGRIPTSMDEVTVVSASQAVSGHPKTVYLLGVNEGVFPRRVSEEGVFSDGEKETLTALGIELTDRRERRIAEELYFLFRAAALPSERLYVSYSHYGLSGEELRPSLGVKRIRTLFPKLAVTEHEKAKREDLIESRPAAFEHSLAFSGNLGNALRAYFAEIPEYAEKQKFAETPMDAADEHLTPAAAEELFGNSLKTSYSQLEKYIKCRFSYFCEYELCLRDDLPAKFSQADIGNFVHGVLEGVVKWIASGEKGDLEKETERLSAMYISSLFAMPAELLPKRFAHLFAYLKKSVLLFAKRLSSEFAASAFRPSDFELSVGRDGAVLPMTLENENVSVALRGKVDRVDAYEGGDGKLYLRVVDYKTGDKVFKLDKIKLGLDLQMLLYLFSLWENGGAYYKKEIAPAGVIYAGVNAPHLDGKAGEATTPEELKINTSGLFLDDETVLRAMDPDLGGEFIPIRKSDLKPDSKKREDKLMGLSALETLKEEVRETVLRYADELRRGSACARPLKYKRENPCTYCKMRAFCRTGMKG